MKLKLFFSFVLVFLSSFSAFSQRHDYSFYAAEIYGGYSRLSFLNKTFSQQVNDNNIQYGTVNLEGGFRFINRFLMFNGAVLYNQYQVNSTNPIFNGNRVEFWGLETGLSVFLTPLLSKNFSPYLGAGYLFSGSLSIKEKTTTGSGSSQQSTTNTLAETAIDSPLWKFGVMAAYRRVSLNVEYKQSFATPDKAFQQGVITLAYRIVNED